MKIMSKVVLCALVMQVAGVLIVGDNAEARGRSRARSAVSRTRSSATSNAVSASSAETNETAETNVEATTATAVSKVATAITPKDKCATGAMHGWFFDEGTQSCKINFEVVTNGASRYSQDIGANYNCPASADYCLVGTKRLAACESAHFVTPAVDLAVANYSGARVSAVPGCVSDASRAADAKRQADKDAAAEKSKKKKAAIAGSIVGAGAGAIGAAVSAGLFNKDSKVSGKDIGAMVISGAAGAAAGGITGGVSGNVLLGIGAGAGAGGLLGGSGLAGKASNALGNALSK